MLLKRNEVAKLLNVHVNTVDNYVKDGMPSYKVGKSIRFDENEVIKWFKKKGS